MATANKLSTEKVRDARSITHPNGNTHADTAQRSIKDVWKSAQKRSLQVPTSPSKRQRLSPDQVSPLVAMAATEMFNFSGSGGVIDLTGSAGGSPRGRPRGVSVSAKVENGPSPGGPKRLAVKNFRTTAKTDSAQYVAKTMGQLSDAMDAIFADAIFGASKRPKLSNEELYRGSESVCKLGKAADLATMVTEKCARHVVAGIKAPLLSKIDAHSYNILGAVLLEWKKWTTQMQRLPSLEEVSIELFRRHILGARELHSGVIEGACRLLYADRIGGSADSHFFGAAVDMFHDLAIYTPEFEPIMLAQSQSYIHEWADRTCEASDVPEYVASSMVLIDAEIARCDHFALDPSTKRSLLFLLEDHLIERKEEELNSVADILDLDTTEATKKMNWLYSFLQRRRLGSKLKEPFTKWLDDTGTAIVFNDEHQDKMVVELLEFKQKLDHIWRFAFEKDQDLGHALRSTFEAFMNKSKKSSAWGTDNSRVGEMIAKYVDNLLRAGAKAIPASLLAAPAKPGKAFTRAEEDGNDDMELDEDGEVDLQLDQVLDLFRFVHGKAVFEAFYKKDLARRLLLGRSASNDAEKNMLARLKTGEYSQLFVLISECGAGFTHNLEQMFKDVELADEEAKAYKNRSDSAERRTGIDLTVNILSSAAWPTYPDLKVTIPTEVKRCIEDFEQFYKLKHSGRKLEWKHALAHCQMKADFPKGRKDLIVSSFQAVILLIFNGRAQDEQVSYETIKAESGLSDPECKRTLQSLACAKLRPLTKHPRGREVDATDTFTVNDKFTHDKIRVKINSIQLKETKEENKETHTRVAADRQFETQAAIVRILKSKKKIGHAQLIAEVIEKTRTRGVLQPADIKKEIDKLIEKEYLERAEGNTYEYLA